MVNNRKLPVGIQDFEKLRTNGFVYVDKTAYVYRLAYESAPYFLGRPPRFGKSFLLSILKAYFLGKKEPFEGLAMPFFAGISYELHNKTERHYQTIFYLIFKLMGQFVEVEPRSAAVEPMS
jgi:hypothetical protein